MQLNTFVADYIPMELRHGRDFTGGRGWVHLGNQAIRYIEAQGLLGRDRVFEVPLYVYEENGDYLARLPADCKKVDHIYVVGDRYDKLQYEILAGKLRLLDDYDDQTVAYQTGTTPWTNDGLLTSSAIYEAEADESADWLDKAIYFLTGSNAYEARVITSASYSEPTQTLAWDSDHPFLSALTATDTFVRLSSYLMVRYWRTYATLSAESSEIPLRAEFEELLAHGLCWLASPAGTENRREYKRQFEEDIETIGLDEWTPSMDEARPRGAAWPTFGEVEDSSSNYIGE